MLEWARSSLAPLATVKSEPPWSELGPLDSMIGNAAVVALSEGAHGAAQPLEFRNTLLRYLVQKHGFTAVAIESGVVEARVVHDYVCGASGELTSVLARGINWTHDQLPQNRALVRWLREYNEAPERTRKVKFYGFDMPGCPTSSREHFGHDTALNVALRFLDAVDPTAYSVFAARLAPFMSRGQFHPLKVLPKSCYGLMSQPERDTLTAAIADLLTWFERHEGKYASLASADEYDWAYRAAVGVRQIDNWLRQVPPGWSPAKAHAGTVGEWPHFLSVGTDVRDRAQVDNIEWIVRREGEAGRVLVFASRFHLSAAPIRMSRYPDGKPSWQAVAGTYLRRRFGNELLTIGNLIGKGEVACGSYAEDLGTAPAQSLDGLASEVGQQLFLLDLRRAPEDVSRWLDGEHQLVAGAQALALNAREAFDILFYIDEVTPACETIAAAHEV
jgi:erythromycin esterase